MNSIPCASDADKKPVAASRSAAVPSSRSFPAGAGRVLGSVRRAFGLVAVAALLAVGAMAFAQDKNRQPKKPKAKPGAAEVGVRPGAEADERVKVGERGEGGGDGDAEKDDPIGRRLWFGEWFGPVTADHLDWVAKVGQGEIERWGHLIPGTAAYRKPMLSPNAGVQPRLWRNIGPLDGSSLQDWTLLYDTNIVDTGRPTVIVPHPTNPNTLYVGFAGGGLWRCRNADVAGDGEWVWEPLTDGLPGGGNQSVGAAAIAPDAPDTVYVSLGDMMSGSAPHGTAHGRGFYVSRDGGDTWEKGESPGKCTRTKTVLALPGNRVLVAGNMGLFNSTDGGETFTRNQSGPLRDGAGAVTPTSNNPTDYLPNEYASVWDIVRLGDGTLVLTYQFADGGGSYDGSKGFRGYGVYGGGGIAYSTDDGVTWTKADLPARGPSTGVFGYGRIAIAASGDTLYGLYQDGSIPDSGWFPPKTSSSDAAGGSLLKSMDGGRTWSLIAANGLFNLASDGGQTGYNHFIAVDPQNDQVVFVGTNLALWRSTSGGRIFSMFAHWYAYVVQYIHADMHVGAWSIPANPTKALYIGTDGGMSIVRDPNIIAIPGSASNPAVIDHRRNKGVSTQLVYNIGCTNATQPAAGGVQPVRDRVVAGFQDLGTLVRLNTADNTYRYTGVGGDGFGCLYHPRNGNLALASLYYTRIRRSINGGISNWVDSVFGISGSGTAGSAPFYTRLYLGMADPTGNSVYTFTNAVPYYSGDFGGDWTAMETTADSGWPSGATIRNMNVSPLRQGLVGVLFDLNDAAVPTAERRGTVAISRDNGATWKVTLSAFPGSGGNLGCMAFDSMDEDIMYAASVCPITWNMSGHYMGDAWHHIWKSVDGGDTWVSVDGSAANSNGFPFGVRVYCVKVDPLDSQVVYAGTELGLYYTTNQGQTWERHGSGLPMVAVYDIYIAPDGSFMRVGTHGRGVWEMESAISVAVSPNAATLSTGGTQMFRATLTGAINDAVAWTCTGGDITADGAYTAPAAPGAYTVTATSQEDTSKSGTAAVLVVAGVAVSVSPRVVALVPGGAKTFAVNVTGADNTAVTWTATGGSITTGGAYTAPGVPGAYTVTVTSQADDSRSDRAEVTVVPLGTIEIANPARGLFVGRLVVFRADVTGTIANPDIAWKATSGPITPGGVYTAPSEPSLVTITAEIVQEPTTKDSVQVKISSPEFDENKTTDPQLLGLANAYGSIMESDLGKYDFDNNGRVDDKDLTMLFSEMRW